MGSPATTVAEPVSVTERSARSSTGSLSVAIAGVGSDVPAAGTTRAVFTTVPVKAGSIVPVAVNVSVLLTGTVTVALMCPVPPGAPQVAPPAATQLQLTPVKVDVNVSVTTAFAAVLGPAFVTVI